MQRLESDGHENLRGQSGVRDRPVAREGVAGARSKMSACGQCGAAVPSDMRFCTACGFDTREVSAPDPGLVSALEAALEDVSRTLEDVQAKRIDPGEAQRRLFRSGLVVYDREAWLLDPVRGCWSRYDGLSLETMPSPDPS